MHHLRFMAAAAAMMALPFVANAQSHVYRLDGTLADQNGGPSLVADGGMLTSTGYLFGMNTGLTLSDVFAHDQSYSLVVHSSFDDALGWRKIVDFWDKTSDHGYYAYFGSADFDPYTLKVGVDYPPDVMATSVITRDATDLLLKIYVNGALRYSITDGGQFSDFNTPNGIAHFFEDDFVTDETEATGGFVDYIATYNTVLTDEQVADISQTFATPEPGSLVLVATGLGIGAIALRRRRKIRAK